MGGARGTLRGIPLAGGHHEVIVDILFRLLWCRLAGEWGGERVKAIHRFLLLLGETRGQDCIHSVKRPTWTAGAGMRGGEPCHLLA